MLPFLKHKEQKMAGLIISKRKSDGAGIEEMHNEGEEDHALMECSEELMRATKAGDAKAFSAALRAAFEILDAEPHEEGPHTYDAQNELAAKERR